MKEILRWLIPEPKQPGIAELEKDLQDIEYWRRTQQTCHMVSIIVTLIVMIAIFYGGPFVEFFYPGTGWEFVKPFIGCFIVAMMILFALEKWGYDLLKSKRQTTRRLSWLRS